jgi:hypothetical protein
MKKAVILALMLGSSLAHSETLVGGMLFLLINGLYVLNESPKTDTWHLVTVEWADGNQDTYRVRAPSLNQAIQRVEQRFAQSSLRAVYVHAAGFNIDMNKVLEIG